MVGRPDEIEPDKWLRSVFASRDARCGGVFKRQVRDVERIVGRAAFLAEVERRGWQALENGRHFIVCCNAQPIRRVRGGNSPARAGE
ncbi:N-(5'-phosphoribosyl)anthranilate isomerase [Sinisalibacter lacisalsi]|uniref:N-(5'-phosphoribosyl)anthranilate isomerase n=1 Tax=Sinisalibacter lacisalsi TaxID=1526570 RepID=A0ABQ1QNJ9_9RHOB|nr:N-(5'-phosphoribosyl)anthranilate isomerase [Sinisalibacter lacisalsi]GGD38276.1 hypothetical protein GCM10011358_22590 [Sinisalibacter lacisalsi]